MPAPKIQADYNQLTDISKIFDQHSEAIAQQLQRIRQGVDKLAGGDWQGVGAELFLNEMNGDVMPAIEKLGRALGQASEASKNIAGKMQEAEEDAAKLLLMNGLGANGGGGGSSGGGGGGGGGSGSGGGGGGGSKLNKAAITDKQIQDAINKKDRAEAIRLAAEKYGIDISAAKEVVYDSKVTGEGSTSKNGRVRLGDKAFTSPQWLASSIGHEMVHVNQSKDRWYTGTVGTALNEVEAYDWELKNTKETGVSVAEIKDLQDRRKAHYDALPKNIKDRVDKGDYTLPKGHEND